MSSYRSSGRELPDSFSSWQDFEEFVLILASHFDVIDIDFRKVFSNGVRKFEIDVVAYFLDFCVCLDAKLYGCGRYRMGSLNRESRKHFSRCVEFERIFGVRTVPVIVTFVDDGIIENSGCIVVPYFKLNDFFSNARDFLSGGVICDD